MQIQGCEDPEIFQFYFFECFEYCTLELSIVGWNQILRSEIEENVESCQHNLEINVEKIAVIYCGNWTNRRKR